MLIVLGGVIGQSLAAQFALGPGEIKGMSKEMAGSNLSVDPVKNGVHRFG
jgi:hypothetical protein